MYKTILVIICCLSVLAHAGNPVIVDAKANLKSNQLYDIAVTLRHADTGWDHYAKEWVVIVDGDKEVGKRTLHHPHVNEQPFTRYLRDVQIPADVQSIKVYAKCNKGHKSQPHILFGE